MKLNKKNVNTNRGMAIKIVIPLFIAICMIVFYSLEKIYFIIFIQWEKKK